MKWSSLAAVSLLAAGVAACSGRTAEERGVAASPTPSPSVASAPPLAVAPGDTLPAAPSEPEASAAPAPRGEATPVPPGHIDPATGVRIEDQPTPAPKRRGSRSHPRSTTSTTTTRPPSTPPSGGENQPQTRIYGPDPADTPTPSGQPTDTRTADAGTSTLPSSRDAGRDRSQDALPPDDGRDGSVQPSAPDVRTTVRRSQAPVVLPEGTELPIRLDQTVASDSSRPEQDVTAELAEDVRVNGRVVLAAGSEVLGHVVVAQPSGRVRGRARLVVAFDEVRDRGRSLQIEAWRWDVTAESSRSHDTKIAGGAAAAGAIIGAITGGVKGAIKGGILGGAAGGAAVLVTRGQEVEIRAGTNHTITLRKPVRIE